jgi:hypothetical protein
MGMGAENHCAEPAVATAAGAGRPVCLHRRVFSFPVLLAFGLAVLTFSTARSRFNDPDAWFHLKIGETIWSGRSVPRTDLFSFTTNHHARTTHEWLSELLLYGAYRIGGYRGLWLWLAGTASAVLILVYACCCLYSGNAKVALLGGFIGWFFGTVNLALRPVILGYLFLAAELLILHLARMRSRRWLWTLPLLFVVWVNCHGSFALGLVVLGIFGLCSFVNFRCGLVVSQSWDRGGKKLVCLVFALCSAALLVNPVGLRLVAHPLDPFTHQSESLLFITEWAPLDFGDIWGKGLSATAVLIGLVLLLRQAQIRVEEILLLLLGAGMALRHTRFVFVFGILAAPVVCRLLAGAWDRYEPARDHPILNGFLMLLSIAIMAAMFPSAAELEQQVNRANPVKAVGFIRRTGLQGPMLNEYGWGGYLIWAMPEQKVFIDGRGDVFDWTGVMTEYRRWSFLMEDPELLLNKYRIQYCLLRRENPMCLVLPRIPGWRQVYADELSVIIARK